MRKERAHLMQYTLLEEYMGSVLFSEAVHSICLRKEIGGYEVVHHIESSVDLSFVRPKVYNLRNSFKEKNTKLLYKIRHEHKFLFTMKKKTKTSEVLTGCPISQNDDIQNNS